MAESTNIKQYCERMAKSAIFSTKRHIPEIIKAYEPKNLLDVGCADGQFTKFLGSVLTKKCHIDAIDPGINECYFGVKSNPKDNIEFRDCAFTRNFAESVGTKYDCVLFSSVMHEISSYFDDPTFRYGALPIRQALSLAGKIVNPHGIVVVRDMLRPATGKPVVAEFANPELAALFLRFVQFCPYLSDKYDKSPQSKFMAYESHGRILFNVRKDVLMEFLMVATWGEASFPRESLERKFILRRADWCKAFSDAGFEVKTFMETCEEYPTYFGKLVRVWDEKWFYPPTTCLIVAQRKN